ncbi:fungal-specific transcription factor domain-containing protein [Thelonectria olida]|uniref:Fungal-specific transcription factor domain-containing protein n=1 Tax=Thelonectria olida TaxID=1576542 RepID=A0A9P8VSF0_9HYPO|nr:fungal-specific transcription factor domain-containing protein [Thelonectria olida]
MGFRRIRFAPVQSSENKVVARVDLSPPLLCQNKPRAKDKGRSGCLECKAKRVKCDETFPICRRCQRHDRVCHALPRLGQWRTELPWIMADAATSTWNQRLEARQAPFANRKFLKMWFERTSRIMVLDDTSNPFSFALIDYVTVSSSLAHVLQSISAGHEHFFRQPKLYQSLEERGMAMMALRNELNLRGKPLISMVLTTYFLGISSTYLDGSIQDFGKEHLCACRRMVESFLLDSTVGHDPMVNHIVDAFVYWEMTCSVLIDASEHPDFETSFIRQWILRTGGEQHPLTGSCTYLFHLLSNMGKYCRAVVDTGERDRSLERYYERELLDCKSPQEDPLWRVTADAYRNHGLMLLHRVCADDYSFSLSAESGDVQSQTDIEAAIRVRAIETLDCLFKVPATSNFLNIQAVPLLTAGSELTKDDQELREEVILRFRAVFSYQRLPANLSAIELLEELWELRDAGIVLSWIELMLQKNWRLRLG